MMTHLESACCPDCRNSLETRGDVLVCHACHGRWPQAPDRKYLDLASTTASNVEPSTMATRLMEQPLFVSLYESVSRPLFSRLFAGPDAGVPTPQRELEKYASWLRERAPGHRPRTLDLSCGTGWFTAGLFNAGVASEVVGIDLSAAMIEAAADSYAGEAGTKFVRGDVYALPFDNGSFDAVINPGSLHLYYRPEAAYREISRVLVAGGVYAGSTFARDDRVVGRLTTRLTGVRRTDLSLLEEELGSAGLEALKVERYGSIFMFVCQKSQ